MSDDVRPPAPEPDDTPALRAARQALAAVEAETDDLAEQARRLAAAQQALADLLDEEPPAVPDEAEPPADAATP